MPRTILCVWSIALSALAIPAPALAQVTGAGQGGDTSTMPLEQLMAAKVQTVVGASRYQQHVKDAPASVTIVTADEIERFGYRTLAEILRGVRGFYVTYDRNYTYLGVRGFSRPGDYNTRVLVLIDGHRLNDNVYDAAQIGTDWPLDLELIERVEVVRGPTSTLYGANAFFGVVNVVTRQAAAVTSSASVEAGSLGWTRVRAVGARTFTAGGVTAAVSRYSSAGQQRIDYPELGASAVDMDHDDSWRVFTAAQVGSWYFLAVGSARDKQIPTGAYGISFDDPGSETTDSRALFDAAFERSFRGTAVSWRGGIDWYRYEGTYISADEGGVNSEYGRAAWLTSSATASRRVGAHHLGAGVDWREDLSQRQQSWFDDDLTVNVDTPQRKVGMWITDEVALTKALLLHGGVSYDRFHQFGSSINFRSAVIWHPSSLDTIKLLYGSAFRAPNAYERFYYESGGDADLSPERVRTAEVVAERHLAPRVRVLGTAFTSLSHALITIVEDESKYIGYAYRNLRDARTGGFEAEAEIRPATWLSALGSYTYQRGHTSGDRAELTNSPRHLAQMRVRAQAGSIVAGVEVVHVGRRLDLQGGYTPSGTLTNLTVSGAELGPHLRLSVSIQNLFDAALIDPSRAEHPQAGIVQDGRTAQVKARWVF
jgi:outer membrane cobalamin receptor